MKGVFERIYSIVQKIPKGSVTTYGEIGRALHISPRVVGYALHMNSDGNKTPCHRVVNRLGRLAPGYAFGGKDGQRKKLQKEEIHFVEHDRVNLKKHLFLFQ